MSWSYSGDPSSSTLDATRYFIGDTDETDQLVQDEEILFQLGLANDNIYNAAAEVADSLALKFARYATVRTPDVTVDYGARAQAYGALAARLREGTSAKSGLRLFAGGISISQKQTVEADVDRPLPAFTRTGHRWTATRTTSDWQEDA